MHVFLPLLIVAISGDAPIAERYPEATEVFRCTFDEAWDENFDEWPDQWTRRRGRGFPHYVSIKINDEPSPAGDRCLAIDLDGGGAVACSPPVAVSSLFDYVLEVYVKTKGLKYDQAFLSLTLLNENRQAVETFESEKVQHVQQWQKIRLGPVSPSDDNVQFAVIGLHLEPESPQKREDLKGSALFADVWLGRLPRMALKTEAPCNLFTAADHVEVTCTTSGFLDEHPLVTFDLEDVFGRRLVRTEQRLATKPVTGASAPSPDGQADKPLGLIGKTQWKPPIPGPGFYRVRATMKGPQDLLYQRVLTLAVIEPGLGPAGAEFGWSLPGGDKPLPLPLAGQLISQAGIHWVKYPLRHGQQGGDALLDPVALFAERLDALGIEVIGLLCNPPAEVRSDLDDAKSLSAAEVFGAGPEQWRPWLEPVLARLGPQVHWWQLGHDDDTSFVGYPNLGKKIEQVRNEMGRLGQEVNLGVGWSWMNQLPDSSGAPPPWQFLAFSSNPPLTDEELAAYLDGTARASCQRWVTLELLPRSQYGVEVCAADMIRRMIAAKIHQAGAVFIPDPFDADHGLMNEDGTVGELFLPWRTAAVLLGGAAHLGSLQLPAGSRNYVFSRGDDAVMVVWNDRPVEEALYLGENVRQFNLWGGRLAPSKQQQGQMIKVERLPTFVTGLSDPVARWSRDLALARDRIPSIFGQPHENSLRFKNQFPQGISGRVELIAPDVWIVEPRQASFRLDRGEQFQQRFAITLPHDANGGRHQIRVDFEVQADRPYRFSVYRYIEVGLGDIYIEAATHLNPQGELEVEQRLVNDTHGRISFRCQLFAPNRQRKKTEILGLAPGQDLKVYRLPDGKELLGRNLWIRAEEIGGPRIFNYRFIAEK